MNRAKPWLTIERVKSASVPENAALALVADIDASVRDRDPVRLRQFAAEAALSGLDQESQRAFEIADLIEGSKAGGRDEATRVKAALGPRPEPSQRELVAAWDTMVMSNGGGSSPDLERARDENENARLAALNAKGEELRRR